jgi:small-conductance mechanosensitive channel
VLAKLFESSTLVLLLQEQAAESTWDKIEDWLLDHGTVLAGIAIFIFVAVLALNTFVPRVVRATTERRLVGKPEEEIDQRIDTLSHVFTRTGAVVLILIGFLTALPEVGVNVGALIAGFGIAGIAIGFGAQSMVKDFLAGIFILVDNQYGRGDVIQVSGVSGVVEDIGLRRTVLRDLDGAVHWIPNGEIQVATNYTEEYSRVNLNIGVSYSEDLDHVIEVINRTGEELAQDEEWGEYVLTPPKVLRVDNFGDSSIDIKVLGDTKPTMQWAVMGELRLRLKKAFYEEGIEIPYPHVTIATTGNKAWDLPRTQRGKSRDKTGDTHSEKPDSQAATMPDSGGPSGGDGD